MPGKNKTDEIDTILNTVINEEDEYKPYRIWKYNGLDQSLISKLRNGNYKIENIPWRNLKKIIDYYDAKQKGLTD